MLGWISLPTTRQRRRWSSAKEWASCSLSPGLPDLPVSSWQASANASTANREGIRSCGEIPERDESTLIRHQVRGKPTAKNHTIYLAPMSVMAPIRRRRPRSWRCATRVRNWRMPHRVGLSAGASSCWAALRWILPGTSRQRSVARRPWASALQSCACTVTLVRP